MKNNYLLIHGSFGSPFSNWIPWLRKELEKDNLEVYTPDFPTGVGYQNYDNWSRLLKAYVESGILNENTIIYAHSIAPIFICKFLVENKIKNIMIIGCGVLTVYLAESLLKNGYKVKIIERDRSICEKYAAILDNVNDFLYCMCGAEKGADLNGLDTKAGAESYLRRGGLTDAQISEIEKYIAG